MMKPSDLNDDFDFPGGKVFFQLFWIHFERVQYLMEESGSIGLFPDHSLFACYGFN
jgi:hypothetical protein